MRVSEVEGQTLITWAARKKKSKFSSQLSKHVGTNECEIRDEWDKWNVQI